MALADARWHVLVACTALAVSSGCGGVGPKVKDYKQYAVSSSFNVQSEFTEKSTVGKVLNLLNDLGDEPDDPGKFVVEQLIEFLPTPLDVAAKPLAAELGRLVNAQLVALIPSIVEEVKNFSVGVSALARVFTVESTLDVGLDASDRYTGSHELKRVTYSFAGAQLPVEGVELGPLAIPTQIPVELRGTAMTIDSHELPLPVGSILAKGVDRLVIPKVAKSCPACLQYADLITWWLSCAAIAKTVAEKVQPENVEAAVPLVLAACQKGSNSLSGKLTEMIADLDREGGFRLEGKATVSEDRSTVSNGTWLGEYRIGKGVQAELESGSTFEAREVVP
jgi:hypothetical protein